ncbi:DsbA family protein [Kangiella marina]|uniref:DSBA-like thioredoxin domain-containing protein n=1 Tax=Kangiella marina TaxID=1079178 RepID=A0ABP8IJ51_9GAMM
MRKLLIALGLALMSYTVTAEFTEGKEYWEIAQPEGIPVATDDNLFFTWLGCDSCRKIEAELSQDLEGFEVVPLIARQNWRPAAKVFYVIQMLDGEAEALLKIKQQIDEGELDPTDQKALFEAIFELGYDKEQVAELLEDRRLYNRISQAEALAKNYKIQYAPTVVVKGQYATDARSTMTIKKFREVLNFLKSL